MSHCHTPSSNSGSSTSSHHRRNGISSSELQHMLSTLRHHRVNTLTELHRIEKALISLPNFYTDCMPYLTEAWTHYVRSNNLLNELRGLTRQYPISAEMVEEARQMVYADGSTSTCWNLAYLVLAKIWNDGMISDYARRTARNPAMWGGVVPDARYVQELAGTLCVEWEGAVEVLLRHWRSGAPVVEATW